MPLFDLYLQRSRVTNGKLPLDGSITIGFAHDVSPPASVDEAPAAHWAEPDAPSGPANVPEFAQAAKEEKRRGSVVVTLHNNRAWIAAQLESLFAQWQPGLELILIDDASTDDGFQVALDVLNRRDDISSTLRRTTGRLGLGVIPLGLKDARSDVMIQADSDDIALPGRLLRILERFESDPCCRLVTSNAVLLSPENLPIGIFDTDHGDAVMSDAQAAAARAGDARWLGATASVHREVFERFPVLNPELLPYGLDLLTSFRATLLGTHHYIAEPLVGWRQHASNTHRLMGALDNEGAGHERRCAFDVLVQAQKVRDVRYLAGQHPADGRLAPVIAASQDALLHRTADWGHARARVSSQTDDAKPSRQRPRGAPVPPIPTLEHGVRYRFARGTRMGGIVAEWAGFHDAEDWGVWTKQVALLAFRTTGSSPAVIRLWVAALCDDAHLRLTANFAGCVDAAIGTALRRVDLPFGQTQRPEATQCVTLVVRDAKVPREMDPSHHDDRLLGVALYGLEIV